MHVRIGEWGLLVFAVMGCASGGASTETQPTQAAGTAVASILVQNNSPGSSESQVYIVPEVGQRIPLGSVQSMGSATFSYNAQPGYYTLEVQPTGGSAERSEQFRLTNNDRASWNMSVGKRVVVGRK
jgi:hypothetical protein